ncbi:MAG: class I SAM-dependent methyltransferase [Chlorobia bacterium]|nr:class I SAM-dependent methyltransferase [Fimbriimonadaceae bacterium]
MSQILSLPETVRHRVRKCGDCGFIFLGPYLSREELESLYSGTYFAGKSSELSEGSGLDYEIECAQVRLSKFERTLDDLVALHPQAKSVLDVGAATGEFLDLARKKGLATAGIELSQWASDRAAEKYGFKFSNEPFETFSPGEQYDLIHASHVLEHFPHPNRAASKIAELLSPGGLVYVEVPFQFNAAESLAGRAGVWTRPFSTFSLHHPSFFTPTTLRKLFDKHGLSAKSIKCFNWDRHGDAPTRRSKKLARSFLKLIGQGQIIEGVFEHA